ncbi:hypothetical protein [Corynebacterium comes]|uniref:Secreted protein n=1 Tax=Corynebacterium comes TaxID=2675218 RepID=A0A6B8VMI7_9CORY|nr:hypothetical protein [Corynebacterium comes]QGU05213.1 hypothetical protein CETAM_09820 [Corynebacterium comes]
MRRHRPGISAIVILATALLVTACGGSGGDGGAEESLEVTASETPVAQARQVEPKVAERLRGATTDPGLNVDWTYQGVRSGQISGSVVTVLVHNLNDEPLSPADIPQPTLTYNSGGGTMVEATPITNEDAILPLGLDLPLGAGASTNLRYAFEVSPGNLWDAKLQVGNVIFEGNLNF